MNSGSSRSHAVFKIHFESKALNCQRENDPRGSLAYNSVITFVDLAGSERMKRSKVRGERAKEGLPIGWVFLFSHWIMSPVLFSPYCVCVCVCVCVLSVGFAFIRCLFLFFVLLKMQPSPSIRAWYVWVA